MSDQDRAIKLLKVILENTDLSDLTTGERDAFVHVMCWAALANKPDLIAKVIEKSAFVEDNTDTNGEGQS